MKNCFVDTHCHLNHEDLYQNIDLVLKEAKDNGVELLIVPGYDLASSKKAIEIAHQYDGVYAAVGFHPTEIKNYTDAEYNWLAEAAIDEKVVGIGEIGLDYHWDTTTREEQRESFIRQLKIATDAHKPVIIHCRDANQDTFDIIKEYYNSPVGGVMHSYAGSAEMALEYNKMNFYISLGGPVTFTNAKEPKRVALMVDVKYLLTETDSPYLAPHPYRGTQNSPRYIPLIAAKIAEIKGIEVEELKTNVRENAKRLFKI